MWGGGEPLGAMAAQMEPVDEVATLRDLRVFERHVDMMESQKEELVRKHPGKWAALHGGGVVVAPSLTAVLEKIDEQRVPRSEAAVQFLDPAPLDMIL